jgi:hypothetical protein
MIYNKLQRVWCIPNFRETFPEFNSIDNEEVVNRFKRLGIVLYKVEDTPVNFLTRLSLPFALILIILMLVGLPINFFISGKWHYRESLGIYNWFRALKLV